MWAVCRTSFAVLNAFVSLGFSCWAYSVCERHVCPLRWNRQGHLANEVLSQTLKNLVNILCCYVPQCCRRNRRKIHTSPNFSGPRPPLSPACCSPFECFFPRPHLIGDGMVWYVCSILLENCRFLQSFLLIGFFLDRGEVAPERHGGGSIHQTPSLSQSLLSNFLEETALTIS